jgi:hypothetical protein
MMRRFLDGPWWRFAAVWLIVSTGLLAAGAWVFWIRLDGPQWRAGDWRDLAIFWAVVATILLAITARIGRRVTPSTPAAGPDSADERARQVFWQARAISLEGRARRALQYLRNEQTSAAMRELRLALGDGTAMAWPDSPEELAELMRQREGGAS